MKKTFTILIAAIAAIMLITLPMKVVGQTRTAAYVLDFTTINSSHQGYGDIWTYNNATSGDAQNWSMSKGQNNNGQWAYVKFGGKGGSTSSATTSITSYTQSTFAINSDVDLITVNIDGIDANYTFTSMKLQVSSSSSFNGDLVDEITVNSISNSTVEFEPSEDDYWESGSYYKILITGTAKGKNNVGIKITTIVFQEYESGGSTPVDPTITFIDGSVNVGKTLDLSTLFTSNSSGAVNYSITTGGSNATLSGSTLTGVAEGNVTVKASQAAAGSYNAGEATATITVNAAPTLSSIAITTPPTKTTYTEGETFDATGMVVTATYSDASTEDVTASCSWTPNVALTTSDTEITVSYTEGGITKTATQAITVNAYVQPTEIEITPNYTFWGKTNSFSGSTYDELSGSQDNVLLYWTRGTGSTYASTTAMRFYKNNTLTFTAPTGYEIKSIELTVSGTYSDLSFSPTGFDSETTTWSGSSTTVTMTRPSNASSYAQISKFTITIGLPSSDPSLAAEDVDLNYDDENGSISYTLTNPKDGGAVTAAITAGNTGNWLSIGNPSNSNESGTVALTCAANTGAERTATVTLTYTYNTKATIEEEVTVTQAVNPNYVSTITEVRAQGTGAVHTQGVVTSVNGKTAYIQDSGAAIAVYDSQNDLTVAVGDQIDVTGTLGTYSGLLQIQSPTISVLSNNNAVTPEVMTIAQVNASTKQGWLVKIEGATVSIINNQNVTIAQSSNSVVVRFNSPSDITFVQNDVITLTGNIGYYNAVQIANPTDITVQQVPAISVNQTSLTDFTYVVDNGPSTTKTVSVSGANLTANITLSLGDNSDFEMSTTEGSGYTNSLTLTQSEGSVAATTVYVRLKSGLVVGDSYSGTITLSSTDAANKTVSLSGSVTEPVVDYATLPFDWNDASTPTGVTKSNIGSYGSGLRLKFNNNNNDPEGSIVLKTGAAPGTISFTIKANPATNQTVSHGTFSIMTSSNGTDYTTLASYTEIGTVEQTLYFTNLNTDTRYIKWHYNKTDGNVALGDIHVGEVTDQSTTWTAGTFTPQANHVYVVNSGATLILDGDYSETLTNASNLIIEDGGKLITHNAVAATVKKNIIGYGNDNSVKTGWNFIASPITESIAPSAVTNLLGEQTSNNPVTYNYDLYRLSGITEGNHQVWENYRLHNTNQDPFMLLNSKGYLYAKQTNTTLSFAGTVKPYDADLNIPVTEGWNLIGNPYTFDAYANVAYYAMNEAGTGITATTVATSTAAKPCTGIIIYAEENGNVKFLNSAPSGSANNGNLQMLLAHKVATRDGASVNKTIDNAIVSFNEGTKLQKFYFGEPAANIFIPQNGEDYAIAFSNRQGDMPLNFKTTEAGMYTISFEGDNMDLKGVSLIDMLAEEEIDLSVDPSYTFIGSPADKAERFKIVFSPSTGSGADIFAYQSGSDIIVSGEGELQIFDVMGRKVKTQYVSGVQTVNVNAQGVYIMKLNEKTQKIIVR